MNTELSLTLTHAETELLREILEQHQRRMLREIARADHHDYKVILKRKESVLQSVLDRLMVAA
jgi:vacuolar-type H+-ATPase subunit E/Vma4